MSRKMTPDDRCLRVLSADERPLQAIFGNWSKPSSDGRPIPKGIPASVTTQCAEVGESSQKLCYV